MLYTVKQLRQIEQSATQHPSVSTLMQKAGLAAANAAQRLLQQTEQQTKPQTEPQTEQQRTLTQAAHPDSAITPHSILILAGPGNNGGDALEAAVLLATTAASPASPALLVHVLHHASAKVSVSQDTAAAIAKARACPQLHWLPGDCSLDAPAADQMPAGGAYALVIDGLFGIGLKPHQLPAMLQRQIEQINALSCPILALDVPSGLDADTGALLLNADNSAHPNTASGTNPGGYAIVATNTITFIADKAGLHTGHGRDYAGKVEIADLGLTRDDFPVSSCTLSHAGLFPLAKKPRRHTSHKGSFGTVSVIGGAPGMQGAAILAARSALYAGAGRVIAGFVDIPPHFDANQPEIMCRSAKSVQFDSEHGSTTVIVIGPGLGNAVGSFDLLSRALLSNSPLVIDADALTLLAQQPALHALCSGRGKVPTILTPHPLEAARLLACSVQEIQADRLGSAKKIAVRFNAIVILKGSGSIIASPAADACAASGSESSGSESANKAAAINCAINPTGNPGLASAGTGDVLAGLCGALLAQYGDPWQAALAATYFHGAAADALVAEGLGPIGLCASDLLNKIRWCLNSLD